MLSIRRSCGLTTGFLLVLGLIGASTSAAAERPTRAQFIKRADAVCRAYDDKEVKAAYPGFMTNETSIRNQGPKVLVLLRAKLAALRKLTPPAGDAVRVAAVWRLLELTVNAFAREIRAERAGTWDPRRREITAVRKRLDTAADRYGFIWCP